MGKLQQKLTETGNRSGILGKTRAQLLEALLA